MDIKERTINTIRLLCADMVQKAKSGHPGLPLGAAPMAWELFSQMKIDGSAPNWPDRDRFVLSAGHGSTLLYAMLHLFGYDLSMGELKTFRQYGSKATGHPEYKETAGVDISTGPLGQGVANAVGMALAETFLAAHFNRPGHEIVNHYTYALCGDGCLMQGVSNEAASLAGTLKLGKLILFYDSNNISIEGSTDIAFSEDAGARFEALGWDVRRCDSDTVGEALKAAKQVTDKPSILVVKTVIGFGSPNKAGKPSVHGEPLGEEELALTKKNLGFDAEQSFYVPDEVTEFLKNYIKNNVSKRENWEKAFVAYGKAYPELKAEWDSWQNLESPDLENDEEYWTVLGDMATRESSGKRLNYISKKLPNLIGGSADLAPSNKSKMDGREYYSAENRSGSNIHFGAREFSMTAISNGMAVHGGLRPYAAEFFVFSDYMKPALRMSSLMGLPLVAILTHDSIGVGEDGPSHQPVEQLASLRSMPGMTVIRPADDMETAAAWQLAITRKNGPTALVLTRQKCRHLEGSGKAALKGGYILKDNSDPDIIIIASGSEVALALDTAEALSKDNVKTRVVSMPSMEVFEEQPPEYKESVLPKTITKRLVIEAGTSFGWHKYAGLDGDILSIEEFGKSGKMEVLFETYGFTVENALKRARALLT